MERKPTSPGEILSEEFLKPLGLSEKALARRLGCDYEVIHQIVNAEASLTPELGVKLASVFETTPDFWLNAQRAVDLWN